jgi:hypothetical protein
MAAIVKGITLKEVGLAAAVFTEDKVAPWMHVLCHFESLVASESVDGHSFNAHY